jgi:hypothetical protein
MSQLSRVSKWLVFCIIFFLAACGGESSNASNGKTLISTTTTHLPTATATVPPGSTATFGPTCSGDFWRGAITEIDPGIPLPPQTVYGGGINLPSVNGWAGRYNKLCTSGNVGYLLEYMDKKMTENGWTYGKPTDGCPCNGDLVWSKAKDGRHVHFDDHPNMLNGAVQWGATVFRRA